MFNASKTQRLFFFNMSVLSLIGLWLTGFDKVHWFTYVIPAGLLFAAATGLCLDMIVSGKIMAMLGVKD